MNQKLLTISVASYNIERYLDKLMDSVLDERILDSIEVLIVNDGSSDGTANMADAYQSKYPDTVRHINKENGGHGSTINRGIKEATGKYFRALDGDDWVDTEALVALVGKLSAIDTDIILNDFKICYEAGGESYFSFDRLNEGEIYRFEDVTDKIKKLQYHAVIYRTAFLQEHNVTIGEKCFYVDFEFVTFPVPYVQNLIYLKLPVYCYRIGIDEQSVSAKGKMKHIEDNRKVTYNALDFLARVEKEISAQKREFLYRCVAIKCNFYINALWLFKPTKAQKQKIIDFDKDVKNTSTAVFDEMANDAITIKLLRQSKYLLYRILRWYKINKKN